MTTVNATASVVQWSALATAAVSPAPLTGVEKGTAVPATGRRAPCGCETPRLTHFVDNWRTVGCQVARLTRRPRFTPRQLHITHICYRLEGLRQLKNPVTSSEIEFATFRLAVQSSEWAGNRMEPCIPPRLRTWRNKYIYIYIYIHVCVLFAHANLFVYWSSKICT
jgi:hypothetical protein